MDMAHERKVGKKIHQKKLHARQTQNIKLSDDNKESNPESSFSRKICITGS